ncbi:hypothetical protein O181_029062 [Austropuccinia psidii MF-1]|uniref:Cell division control protein 25 n=1 Tax=Austropuccinia psidii MF-1 TaxID=1389203 RepID=A0A9Q3CVT9_9BASI|nr:hypothetical protein [Austropuccinia psidii MF-1]
MILLRKTPVVCATILDPCFKLNFFAFHEATLAHFGMSTNHLAKIFQDEAKKHFTTPSDFPKVTPNIPMAILFDELYTSSTPDSNSLETELQRFIAEPPKVFIMESSNSESLTIDSNPSSSSISSSIDQPQNSSSEPSFFVEALYAFNGDNTASLSFQKGDVIEVLTQLSSGWWDGVIWRQRERGWFPSNYVRRITDQEAKITRAQLDAALAQDKLPIETSSDKPLPTLINSNHHSSLSLSSNHNLWENNNQDDLTMTFDQFQLRPNSNHDKPQSSLELSSDHSLTTRPPSRPSNLSSNLSSNQTHSNSTTWADWIPKVSDDGQIVYINTLTGEISSDIPSGDDEPHLEDYPQIHHHPSTNHHQLNDNLNSLSSFNSLDPIINHQSSLIQSNLEDSIKFLKERGFSIDQLSKSGLLPPFTTNPTTFNSSFINPTDLEFNLNPSHSSKFNSINQLHHLNQTHDKSSLDSNISPTQLTPASSSNWAPAAIEDSNYDTQTMSQSSIIRPSSQSTSIKSSRLSTNLDAFQVSRQIKDKLRPFTQIPPTLTLSQMAWQVKEAISLLSKLTAPIPDDENFSNIDQPLSDQLRDHLIGASMNLVHTIRFLLQSSCQLDNAVLTIFQELNSSLGFHSNSSRPSSIPPLSPYPSSSDSSFAFSSHYRSDSTTGRLSINSQLNFPDLKQITRKIASTLSKLTLSARALWGLLSTNPSDPTQSSDDSSQLVITQKAQARHTLEQKLRLECKIGASDLASNIDTFFHLFESNPTDKSIQSSLSGGSFKRNSAQHTHLPRHGRGHLTIPIESLFLPGGAKGGNWTGSGYDIFFSSQSSPFDNSLSPALPISPLSSNGPLSSPDTKLDSERFKQQLLPLIQQAIGLGQSLNTTLLLFINLEKVNQETIETGSNLTSSSQSHAVSKLDENNLDLILNQISEVIDVLGNLLSTSETFNVLSSLEVDLDPFIWFGISSSNQLKELVKRNDSLDQTPLALPQLQSARGLVNNFEKTKQTLYEGIAELVHATQTLLTSGGSFWSTPMSSPAQPPTASPLFALNQPINPILSPAQLNKTISSVMETLDSFKTASESLALEIDRQSSQDLQLGPINQIIKSGLTQRTSLSSFNSQALVTTGRMKSNSSSTHNRNSPPSPRSHRLSRGIHEEQEELERTENFQGGDESLKTYSNPPSSSLTLVNELDPKESGPSRSPTRSKNLAKFFGEEAATQVVATKPSSSKPTFLLPDYGPDDISFNADNQVRGGSLRGLVIKLTSHEGPDVPFLRVFLMTYRTFTTSRDFLDLLIERYHQAPPPNLTAEELQIWTDQKQKVIEIRVINVLRSWIESHLSDEDSESILARIDQFSQREMKDRMLSKQLALSCERRRSRGALSKMTTMNPPGNPPPPILPRNLRKIKFLDIDPLELARQLSLVESKLFCQIQVNECLGKAWPKEFAKEGTPNIKAMIDMSNALTRWVAETILMQPEQKKRANTIKHFILIADRCRSLNNFSTLMQIIAGLNSTPIYRLRRTWETIPQKTLTLFAQLGSVMSPNKNYATYRDTIRNMAPPCVPFVGVYLTDWTFIGDGNPDNLREKTHQINFNKRQKAAELIVQIQSYQSMPYQFLPVKIIISFLEESLRKPKDEKELYEMSLEIEPRERDDEKIARLLAESGFL